MSTTALQGPQRLACLAPEASCSLAGCSARSARLATYAGIASIRARSNQHCDCGTTMSGWARNRSGARARLLACPLRGGREFSTQSSSPSTRECAHVLGIDVCSTLDARLRASLRRWTALRKSSRVFCDETNTKVGSTLPGHHLCHACGAKLMTTIDAMCAPLWRVLHLNSPLQTAQSQTAPTLVIASCTHHVSTRHPADTNR